MKIVVMCHHVTITVYLKTLIIDFKINKNTSTADVEEKNNKKKRKVKEKVWERHRKRNKKHWGGNQTVWLRFLWYRIKECDTVQHTVQLRFRRNCERF